MTERTSISPDEAEATLSTFRAQTIQLAESLSSYLATYRLPEHAVPSAIAAERLLGRAATALKVAASAALEG